MYRREPDKTSEQNLNQESNEILGLKFDYLNSRIKKFRELTIGESGLVDYLTPLCALIKINEKISNELISACKQYVDKSSGYSFKNRTPNGFLVPKIETEKEYVDVLLSYKNLLMSLNLSSNISAVAPPVVRYKTGNASMENLNRPTSSEFPHSDAWAGWPSNSVLPIIPISGDCEKNKVVIFDLPRDISPEWLDKTPFPEAQLKFVNKCRQIETDYTPGFMLLLDICVVHKTHRYEGSQDRVGIDSPILLKNNLGDASLEKNLFGQEHLISWDNFLKIGAGCDFKTNTHMGIITGISGEKRPGFFDIVQGN